MKDAKIVKVATMLNSKTYHNTCSIHKSCHLMRIDGREPNCPKCEQEKIEKEKIAKGAKFKENRKKGGRRRRA
ncbi:hypothetical protein [Lactobacillus taiwanensis]|uniref:hypothetical protein n=1 Tax=Lactobacillus taiwanensis TaxID=508451 RepID=UPI000B9942EE|nr:hypothetical protein [Lactobacillus taiwanensis]OYS39518.1 hypothetical protein CBF85_01080 [Lactobacillus taiwanensis]